MVDVCLLTWLQKEVEVQALVSTLQRCVPGRRLLEPLHALDDSRQRHGHQSGRLDDSPCRFGRQLGRFNSLEFCFMAT